MTVHSTSSRSAELSWASLSHVAAHETIRCRRDYIVVEPLEVDHGGVIVVKERTKPLRGIVKAVELGGYEYGGYAFQTFIWGSKLHLICREADVSGVVEPPERPQTASDDPRIDFYRTAAAPWSSSLVDALVGPGLA